MEGLLADCPTVALMRDALRAERFTLIDVGCAGGIDAAWRQFGDRLTAIGFDPNLAECERLQSEEANPNVRYVAAFVGIPPDHPFAVEKANRLDCHRVPWLRMSAAHTYKRHTAAAASMTLKETVDRNLWHSAKLADPASRIFLDAYLEAAGITNVDFVKLDVDGPDFDILQSISRLLEAAPVVGVGMEVNYSGSEIETDHTFHNTDRFMKAHGFELFHLTRRPYSLVALPSRYQLGIAAQTEFGRPLQGDAIYVRDVCNPAHASFAGGLSDDKLLKIAAIFAAIGLPDCAAETLCVFRERLDLRCDVDAVLDALALQAQDRLPTKLGYRDYMAEFEVDSDIFYVPRTHHTRMETDDNARLRAEVERRTRELAPVKAELERARIELAAKTARLASLRGSRLRRLALACRARLRPRRRRAGAA